MVPPEQYSPTAHGAHAAEAVWPPSKTAATRAAAHKCIGAETEELCRGGALAAHKLAAVCTAAAAHRQPPASIARHALMAAKNGEAVRAASHLKSAQ